MRAVVLFVFLAVPKACPLSIIWRTQAVSGLTPLRTNTLAGEWEQGRAEKHQKAGAFTSDSDRISEKRWKWSLLTTTDNICKAIPCSG
jgi:hypothetical protein